MSLVCPFARLTVSEGERPSPGADKEGCDKKAGHCSAGAQEKEEKKERGGREQEDCSAVAQEKEEKDRMSLVCPFARLTVGGERPSSGADKEGCDKKAGHYSAGAQENEEKKEGGGREQEDCSGQEKVEEKAAGSPAPKCPFGYDSGSFKLGPLSCVLCRALLFDTHKCVPCGHLYCRFCISRFQDCPLCGATIEGLECDKELQKEVDHFIEGHARVKRSISQSTEDDSNDGKIQKNVVYEDVSLARGSFLVQQAMRAFQAQNLESAIGRLSICATDIREEIERSGSTPEACIQLGAVLGMLGDCSRAMGDSENAIKYYEESVSTLSNIHEKDAEVVHALSVSLNKIGDLKYYAEDLHGARMHYARALDVRKDALTDFAHLSSQLLDLATSLAKVADVDRALGNDTIAKEGFQEAIKTLENLSAKSNDNDSLERRRISILEFLHSQIKEGI